MTCGPWKCNAASYKLTSLQKALFPWPKNVTFKVRTSVIITSLANGHGRDISDHYEKKLTCNMLINVINKTDLLILFEEDVLFPILLIATI